MFGKSLASWLILFLTTIGLVSGQFKFWNKLGFIGWLLLTTTASVGYVYWVYQYFEFSFDVPGVMMFMTTNICPAMQMIGGVITLTTTSHRIPHLVQNLGNPPPRMMWLFGLVIISLIFMVYIHFKTRNIILILGLLLYDMLSMTNFFMVGVSVSLFWKNLDNKDLIVDAKSAKLFAPQLIKECKSLKSYLSPICFIWFVVQTGVLITTSFSVLTCKTLVLLPELIFAFLSLLYACLIIDECFGKFKTLSEKIR